MTAAKYVAVGAGRMGRGIAIAFAYAGHRVAIVDLKPRPPAAFAELQQAVQQEVQGSLAALADLGALGDDGAAQARAIAARITLVDAAGAPAAIGAAELLFEALPETLDAKREALQAISRHAAPDAIVTSTTSSILVTDLVQMVARSQRFFNMHWLNPAYVIPVVEISTHPGTDPAVVARTRTIMEGIGKRPVVCGVAPGYIVPRLQALIMNEAARMIDEGVASAEEIDQATRYGLGLRFAAIGVVEFIDFGGADILHHASREMSASIDHHRYAAPANLGRMMDEGRLGLKTGSGFYDYSGRDVQAYRRDVLARTLGMLRHAGLWRAPAAGDDGG
jgi:3-hydroxybutyryl-CoA dehydrogenase